MSQSYEGYKGKEEKVFFPALRALIVKVSVWMCVCVCVCVCVV